MRFRLFCILPVLFLVVSCRTVAPPNPEEVARIQAAFDMATPRAFEMRLSLVFEFRPHWWWFSKSVNARGYANMNPATGDYTLVCVSPEGGKLFDVERTNGQTNARISMPVTGDPREVGKIIGDDFSSFFFDLVPPRDAAVAQEGDRLVFRSRSGEDWREYTYDVTTTRLMGKHTSINGTRRQITYDDYQRYDFGVYPLAMKLINFKSRYSLEIHTLSIKLAR